MVMSPCSVEGMVWGILTPWAALGALTLSWEAWGAERVRGAWASLAYTGPAGVFALFEKAWMALGQVIDIIERPLIACRGTWVVAVTFLKHKLLVLLANRLKLRQP